MPLEEDDILVDTFSRLLADYDEALAGGSAVPLGETLSQVEPAVLTELRAAQDCLRLLEQRWPRTQRAAVDPATADPLALFFQGTPGLERFQFQRKLGQGGHGVVFLAFDTLLRREVALKLPRLDAVVTPALRKRFLREAQACAALKHPNLIAIYDAGEAGPLCYIAEAYCGGPTLSAWLKQQTRPLNPRLAAEMVRTLADAVEAAHRSGILHRDLKPGNVLLEPKAGRPPATPGAAGNAGSSLEDFDYTLKLTDFGLAKLADADASQAETVTVVGTIPYMAPEQAAGCRHEVGPATDVYALGVTLFELLSGRKPFDGESGADTLRRIVSEEPRSLHRLRPDIPPDLEAICLKCLEKSPSNRYPTAAALAEDLGRFLHDWPTHARPIGTLRRGLKWGRRHPTMAALMAVSVLAALGLAAASMWHGAQLKAAMETTERIRGQAGTERELAERRDRRYRYASDMRNAFAAWNNFRLTEMIGLLEKHRPKANEEDLRSFAWHYLWQVSHGELMTLRGHAGEVHCVAYAPDGHLIATASFDGTVKLWDARSGKELVTFLQGHKDEVNALAFSPDGNTLATAGDARMIRLWDTSRRVQKMEFAAHPDDVNALAFAPDGKMLASGGGDRVVKIWDLATRRELAVLTGHGGAIHGLAFSPDGKTLATAAGDNTAILWDVASKRARAVLRGHAARVGYTDAVYALAYAPDGKTVATGAEDLTVRLWDAGSGREKATFRGLREVPRSLAYSNDGKSLVAGMSDGGVWIWDASTSKLRRKFCAHASRVWSVAFSPDGEKIATTGADQTAKIWPVDSHRSVVTVGDLPGRVGSLSLNHGGRLLSVSYWWPGVEALPHELWELGSTVVRRALPFPGGAAAFFSPHGGAVAVRTLAERPWHVDIYDGPSWRRLSGFDLPEPAAIVWSSHERSVVTYSAVENPVVRVWNVATGEQLAVLRPRDAHPIMSAAYSPSAATLACGHFDGTLRVLDLTNLHDRTVVTHGGSIFGLAFSTDGQWIATSSADGVRLWDVTTLSERATLHGHQGPVNCLAFCADERTLASGGGDGTIRLWDLDTLGELLALPAHEGGVSHLAFTADGRTLVSAGQSADGHGEVAIWRTKGD